MKIIILRDVIINIITTAKLMEKFKFECKLSKNYIEFICDPVSKKIYMERCDIDYDNPRLFFILLRKSINTLTQSKNKYTTFVQQVTKTDWDTDLKKNDKWSLCGRVESELYVTIECNISDALYCISSGLGG